MNFYLLIDNLFIREGIRAILTDKYHRAGIKLLGQIQEINSDSILEHSILICSDPLVYYNFQPKILNLVHKKRLKTVLLANSSQMDYLRSNDTSFLSAIIYTNCSLAELHEAVNCILSGKSYRCKKLDSTLDCQRDFEHFLVKNQISIRELEVVRLVVDGLNSMEIADRLNISYNTVTTHRRNINRKLGLKGPNDLMRLSFRTQN